MTDVSKRTDPFVGRTLDEKYCVEERLGAGGMGAVYRARHLSMDRPVAIKVLHQRFVEDEAARVRFQIEARAAVHVATFEAVSVTDFGQTSEGCVYIVMELLEGRTLREILSREAPIETARAISMMLQASDCGRGSARSRNHSSRSQAVKYSRDAKRGSACGRESARLRYREVRG